MYRFLLREIFHDVGMGLVREAREYLFSYSLTQSTHSYHLHITHKLALRAGKQVLRDREFLRVPQNFENTIQEFHEKSYGFYICRYIYSSTMFLLSSILLVSESRVRETSLSVEIDSTLER